MLCIVVSDLLEFPFSLLGGDDGKPHLFQCDPPVSSLVSSLGPKDEKKCQSLYLDSVLLIEKLGVNGGSGAELPKHF